ncbi:MAG: hypothetical protein ABIA93_05250 [Candidatus Woesearchaeota archaeon]
MRTERQDIIFLAGLLIIAPILIFLFHASFFVAILIYFGIPSLYFSIRNPHAVKKAVLMALPALPLCLILDALAFMNKAWDVASVFSFRLLLIPLEDFLFSFLFVYLIVIAYEQLFGTDEKPNYRRLTIFWLATIILVLAFFAAYAWAPSILNIPYYYTWLLGIVFIIPFGLGLLFMPFLRKSVLLTGAYFFVLMLPWEIMANNFGMWTFPGDYVTRITLFGTSFPLEEFLTWMVFGAGTALILSRLGIGREQVDISQKE